MTFRHAITFRHTDSRLVRHTLTTLGRVHDAQARTEKELNDESLQRQQHPGQSQQEVGHLKADVKRLEGVEGKLHTQIRALEQQIQSQADTLVRVSSLPH